MFAMRNISEKFIRQTVSDCFRKLLNFRVELCCYRNIVIEEHQHQHFLITLHKLQLLHETVHSNKSITTSVSQNLFEAMNWLGRVRTMAFIKLFTCFPWLILGRTNAVVLLSIVQRSSFIDCRKLEYRSRFRSG